MAEAKQSHTLARLILHREGHPTCDPVSAVEREVVESAVRVLKEALANGVALHRNGTELSREDLRSIYRIIADQVWREPDPAGESPVSPLHNEHNGWGPPLGYGSDRQGEEHRLPWPILVMDVIDFLCMMMGPADTLQWEEGES